MQLRIIGLDKVTAEVKAAIGLGVEAGMEAAGARGMQLVQENISSSYLGRPPAVASGVLLNSISYEVSRAATQSSVRVFSQPPGGDYAAYVETGTGPHFPPIAPLLLWVERKRLAATESQALSIAFAIAKTIARRGTLGFGMFSRAAQVLIGEISGIFEAAIAQAIQAAGLAK